LALRGWGRAELCKTFFVNWDEPPVKKNKKREYTQKFWFFLKEKPCSINRAKKNFSSKKGNKKQILP